MTIQAAPLRVHPENPHYFQYHGAPTLLITSAEHYGAVINLDFDFLPYLDRLASCRLNYTRIYPGSLVEREGDFAPANTLAPRPGRVVLPWARSGVPGYALGGNKFDLDTWDEAYFARLERFLAEAEKRAIVVEICFFNAQYPRNWEIQAMYHANNIQDVGHCGYVEAQTLRDAPLVARHEAYVEKIVAATTRHDNVIYEICDEPQNFGTPEAECGAWISRLVECVMRADTGGHLVAQQMDCDLGGAADFSGDPRVPVIVAQYLRLVPMKQLGGLRVLETEYGHGKPIELNETAYYPGWYTGDREAASRVEAWEFMVGGGAGFNHLNGAFTVFDPAGRDHNNDKVLAALTHLRAFLESFAFVKMHRDTRAIAGGVPSDAHAQCLSEPGRQYAFYIHHSVLREMVYVTQPGPWREVIHLAIPPGRYAAAWVSPEHGTVVASETISVHHGTAALPTPPYTVDIALRLVRVTP